MFIFIIFCIAIIIQFIFYLFLYGNFSFSKPIQKAGRTSPVSVIVCAKNEAENLKINLPFLADQDFDEFEIVLVDDASTDNSLEIMQQFKTDFASDKLLIQIQSILHKESKGKKSALSLGINFSKHTHVLLTDADCRPISRYWIEEIAASFSEKKTIVLGYGAYRKIKSSYLNKIIRFETLMTAIQYFSYAKIGKAYMGVGRNMAYTKDEFEKVKGFKEHMDIISGDDDLFINQISNFTNTEICFTKNSFTISQPKIQFRSWIKQKRRHITTSSHYKIFHKLSLGIFFLSQFLFWSLAPILLISNSFVFLTIFLIILRFTVWYIVISKSAYKLNEKDLIRYAPIYEISIIFIQLYIFIRNLISSPKHW